MVVGLHTAIQMMVKLKVLNLAPSTRRVELTTQNAKNQSHRLIIWILCRNWWQCYGCWELPNAQNGVGAVHVAYRFNSYLCWSGDFPGTGI